MQKALKKEDKSIGKLRSLARTFSIFIAFGFFQIVQANFSIIDYQALDWTIITSIALIVVSIGFLVAWGYERFGSVIAIIGIIIATFAWVKSLEIYDTQPSYTHSKIDWGAFVVIVILPLCSAFLFFYCGQREANKKNYKI